MVLFNYSTKELTAKIVYYGPGLCGKTTNLQYIHGNLPGNVKGKMLSLATKTDRTLFFDFLPIDLGEIRGMKTRVQLYTVPGQVFYNETRKLVLKGADGIVFVADSQEQMLSANVESFKNLEENLRGHGLTLAEMPHVIQFNKRDLPKLATIEQLNQAMNKYNAPFYESVATTGIGIQDTLKAITKLVLLHLTRKYDPRAGASAGAARAAKPAAPQAPAVEPAPQAAAPTPEPAHPTPAPGPAETQAIPLTEIQPSIEAPTIAVATEQPAYAQPVAASTASAPTIEIQPQIEVAPAQDFNDNDIDELVGEVEELGDMAAEEAAAGPEVAVAEPEIDSPFEIDESNIPLAEDVEEPPALTVEPESETEVQAIELQPEADAGTGYDFSIEPAGDDFTNLPEVPAEAQAEGPPEAAAVEIEDPVEEPAEELDFEEEQAGAHAETAQAEVFLTEVAEDDELFDDPNLDVASIAPGESREVVIPVEIGAEGQAKRFKLCVRLKLDAIE